MRNWIFLSLIILSLTSCVSKKKYLQLKHTAEARDNEYEKKYTSLSHYNDSLLWAMNKRDSIIDSLSLKLVEFQQKREKQKSSTSYNYTKKNSSLTKEQEYSKKAVFIYNFTKNIDWPLMQNGAEFVIGVAGDDAAIKELKAIMEGRKVGGKMIIIKKYSAGNRYNLIYIDESQSHNFARIKSGMKKNKTLFVTDDQNLNALGAHISFTVDKDEVKFIINKSAIEKAGLKVSEELINLQNK